MTRIEPETPMPLRFCDRISGRKAATFFVLIAALVMTGCESIDDLNPFTEKQGELPPPCPSVSILADTERLTVFRDGTGRDLTDIDTEAEIYDFIANCMYDVDDETGVGVIDVEISLGVTAARGPANTTGTTVIPYFVTLATIEKDLINKGVFDIPVAFEGNRYRLTVYDKPVFLTIPIEPPDDGYNYRIYVGLQVTKDQLEYNQTVNPLQF